MAAKGPDAKKGQVYADRDTRMNGRTLTVLSVDLQKKTEGRFKARYTYATCVTRRGVEVKVDTDRLRDPRLYRLDFNPTEVLTGIDVPVSEASTPQAEP